MLSLISDPDDPDDPAPRASKPMAPAKRANGHARGVASLARNSQALDSISVSRLTPGKTGCGIWLMPGKLRGEGRAGRVLVLVQVTRKNFFVYAKLFDVADFQRAYTVQNMNHTFHSLPLAIRPALKASEQRLERIYEAARKGLKNDALALASGLLPVEFNRLKQMDPMVELAVIKGKADAEAEMADVLVNAARQGDAKAALDVLKHVHGWQAAQQLNVTVQAQISIKDALAMAEQRVIEGTVYEHRQLTDG
jgi:hypothetical protein